ncbi:hypothetical protein F3J12_20945 [Burkholderia sp. Ax-1735]|nr:hypothetical protein [Burkholderia sp. Ap-955]NIF11943.1 hypothetical protein [Burkholderia sp. Ax-1735]NIG05650.1 hypothetical protein [Burkholderia sp. Tr-849]
MGLDVLAAAIGCRNRRRACSPRRARALELCVEVNRRQGGATPDVHDFNLPTIIELQRRFGTRSCPSGEAGTAAPARFM